MNIFLWAIILVQMAATGVAPAKNLGTIEVRLSGLRNDRGVILASIFGSEKGFPGVPEEALHRKEVPIKGEIIVFEFNDLPVDGTYAIAVIHDENQNQNLDTNFVGIPKEGMGTSNNVKPKFRAPKFDEAAFRMEGSRKIIEITMTYF